ncbi:flagellar motor protein MotD [Hahella sp. SMD15-11]|uniref:Flagellar motor protein MotD n=1 Tax=Thermohahella caldifontis TaxID=3142973 RepID=A0AB39UX13_9GAMM
MRRRRMQEEPENHERWLVSYADFITLLFAFFVVMYSVSSVNEGKYKVLSETLEGVFQATQKSMKPVQVGQTSAAPEQSEVPVVEPFPTPDTGGDAQDARRRLKAMADQFYAQMEALISDGLISLNESDDWLEITLQNKVLFGSGDAIPRDEAFPLIDRVAAILKPYPNAILVEGFTDNQPIRSRFYPSNWELSAARAAAVVRLLVLDGIDPQRLAAVGYGEQHPVARNDTPEGRQRNRRVVLLVSKANSSRLALRH